KLRNLKTLMSNSLPFHSPFSPLQHQHSLTSHSNHHRHPKPSHQATLPPARHSSSVTSLPSSRCCRSAAVLPLSSPSPFLLSLLRRTASIVAEPLPVTGSEFCFCL
ncbi:hypothetical protein PIB30_100613, partial [Stylosanthes scabra]|nr:hypothetical protein [Stylosanthes scabra]